MAVSELERKRLESIERNKRALQEFQLREAAHLAFGDKKEEKPAGPKLGVSKKKTRKPAQPVRVRNLRRHGISEEDKKKYLDVGDPGPTPQEVKLRTESRKEGELRAKDLIEDAQYEKALEVMQQFRDMSAGDLFNYSADRKPNVPDGDGVEGLRHEMSLLRADDRNIKVVPERITTMTFHPSNLKRIVFAGDKVGNLGLWDADRESDEGLVSFSFHTRNVTNVVVDYSHAEKVYTSSHDQSIRVLDLQSQVSSEVCVLDGGEEMGITDFHFAHNYGLIYYTTLSGLLGRHDVRTRPKKFEPLVLSLKKIGGFAVNPSKDYEIATGSLDRTMKIFDLRMPPAAESDYGALVTAVYNSRLSVSSTSWNSANQIVCNGYDNTVNIFDMDNVAELIIGEQDGKEPELKPSVTLQHNCQTGRWVSILKARWQEAPRDGIQKFVIGNMKRFADVFIGSGAQVAHLDSDQMTAVPAVAQLHRTENWVTGGNSSGKVYLWTPMSEADEGVNNDEAEESPEKNEEL